MKPIPVKPDLVQQVFESIRDAICDGQIQPGERLNQDELATELGVSRQPIVQAIHLLKSQGFAMDNGRRGVEVTKLSVSETTQHYFVRAALDGLAARQAAERNCEATEKQGAAIIKAGRLACAGGTFQEILEADMVFHRFIYELSGNAIISKTVTPLWHQLRRIMGTAITADYPVDSIWDEHQAIFQAILEGRAEDAERLARAHGETAAMRVQTKLNQVKSAITTS
jgi:DNA-binding GntR family transcriptional regulator